MQDSNSEMRGRRRKRNHNNIAKNCDNRRFEKRSKPLRFNSNPNLPFFAYGIFKPGELAYSRIEKYVDVDKTHKEKIPYKILLRDGVPLIKDEINENFNTKGVLIYFNEGNEEYAYDIISNTQPRALYSWKEIEVNGINSNVLMGLTVERGIPKNMETIHDFRGKNDPFFEDAIRLIKKTLLKIEYLNPHDINDFFTLQMNYMLLWSAIERYASLKYDVDSDKIVEFARDNFEIIKNVLEEKVDRKRKIYNSETLWCNILDSNNPIGSMFYYYTIRCNVVHKGKGLADKDFNLLKKSLFELFTIFEMVLKDTFGEDENK